MLFNKNIIQLIQLTGTVLVVCIYVLILWKQQVVHNKQCMGDGLHAGWSQLCSWYVYGPFLNTEWFNGEFLDSKSLYPLKSELCFGNIFLNLLGSFSDSAGWHDHLAKQWAGTMQSVLISFFFLFGWAFFLVRWQWWNIMLLWYFGAAESSLGGW